MREITAVEFAALKTASRALVQAVGGIEAAALVCRYQKSAIAEACSRTAPDRTLPLDVVADLERCAGEPYVTRVLAGLNGHALLPTPAIGPAEAQAIARVLSGGGEVGAAFAEGYADARLSGAERQRLKDALLALIEAGGQAVAALDAASQGERA